MERRLPSRDRIARTPGLNADGNPPGEGKYLDEYDDEGRLGKLWTCNEFEGHNMASSVTLCEYRNDDFAHFLFLWAEVALDRQMNRSGANRMGVSLGYWPK
jgi:hypothetical protein